MSLYMFPWMREGQKVESREVVMVGGRANPVTHLWCENYAEHKALCDELLEQRRWVDFDHSKVSLEDRAKRDARRKVEEATPPKQGGRKRKERVKQRPYLSIDASTVAAEQSWVRGDMLVSAHWKAPREFSHVDAGGAWMRPIDANNGAFRALRTVPEDVKIAGSPE